MREFLWLLRYGHFFCHWQKIRPRAFGVARDWYDGPIWSLDLYFVSLGFTAR